MPQKYDSRYYLLHFPLKSGKGTVVRPSNALPVPWSNRLETSYSPDRLLFVQAPRDSFDQDDWAVQLLQWSANANWQSLRSWRWNRSDTKQPPFAVSNDGRYLALIENGVTVVDTSTLQPVDAPGLPTMFKTALELNPRPQQLLSLTQRLNYLVLKPNEQASNGSLEFLAGGKSYNRTRYYAFISRHNGEIGAFPENLNLKPSGSPIFFQAAAESIDGGLLLLYGGNQVGIGGVFTIRDKGLAVRYQLIEPEQEMSYGGTSGPRHSWDPDHHRMLFYDAVDLARSPQPVQFHILDYEAGTLSTVSVDVASAFRKHWGSCIPKETIN
jgi:hypothetical protein